MTTKKDYELVASVIGGRVAAHPNWSGALVEYRGLVSDLSRAFAGDNPRFNAETFVRACGF